VRLILLLWLLLGGSGVEGKMIKLLRKIGNKITKEQILIAAMSIVMVCIFGMLFT
jgi:hypothetical protein